MIKSPTRAYYPGQRAERPSVRAPFHPRSFPWHCYLGDAGGGKHVLKVLNDSVGSLVRR